MLIPKNTTHKNTTAIPVFPKKAWNSIAVRLTPEYSSPTHNPERIITTAVAVHISSVSKIGPIIATNPCFIGLFVLAVP